MRQRAWQRPGCGMCCQAEQLGTAARWVGPRVLGRMPAVCMLPTSRDDRAAGVPAADAAQCRGTQVSLHSTRRCTELLSIAMAALCQVPRPGNDRMPCGRARSGKGAWLAWSEGGGGAAGGVEGSHALAGRGGHHHGHSGTRGGVGCRQLAQPRHHVHRPDHAITPLLKGSASPQGGEDHLLPRLQRKESRRAVHSPISQDPLPLPEIWKK